MRECVRQNAGWVMALLLGGCTAVNSQTPPVHSPPSPSLLPPAETITSAGSSQRFRIKVTLTSPEDLKVREGDVIVPGQILADKVRDRSRLQFQKDNLIREIAKLKELAALPLPSLKPLPEASFAAEIAQIEEARHQVGEANQAREHQQRKLDVLRTMPSEEVPEAVIPHEEILLTERDRDYAKAAAALESARGQLKAAEEGRRIDEYEHSLEMSRRNLAIREHQLKSQGQIAELEARLSQTEIALSQLAAVRSPYGGRVQRIKFEGQSDQNLSVELTLVVLNASVGEVTRNGQRLSTDPQPSAGGNGGNNAGGQRPQPQATNTPER